MTTTTLTDLALRMEGVRKIYRMGDEEVVALGGVDLTVGSCGTYANENGGTVEVTLIEETEDISVVVARTGKTLGKKSFAGSSACPPAVQPIAGMTTTVTNSVPATSIHDWVQSLTKTDLASATAFRRRDPTDSSSMATGCVGEMKAI